MSIQIIDENTCQHFNDVPHIYNFIAYMFKQRSYHKNELNKCNFYFVNDYTQSPLFFTGKENDIAYKETKKVWEKVFGKKVNCLRNTLIPFDFNIDIPPEKMKAFFLGLYAGNENKLLAIAYHADQIQDGEMPHIHCLYSASAKREWKIKDSECSVD